MNTGYTIQFFRCEASFSLKNDSLTHWPTFSYFDFYCYLQTSDQKTSLTKRLSFDPRGSKLILKTGNGIIQTGNGIISPTSRPLIKKLLLLNVSHLTQGVQNSFLKQDMELSKQEMGFRGDYEDMCVGTFTIYVSCGTDVLL